MGTLPKYQTHNGRYTASVKLLLGLIVCCSIIMIVFYKVRGNAMKRNITMLALMALVLVGCKSTADYDYDQSVNFSALKTYAWVVGSKKNTDSQEFYQSDINQKRIHQAIDSQLQAKGFRKVAPDKADMLVNYHSSVVTKTERNLTNTHPYYWSFGYGYHHSRLGYHMNLSSIERQYKAGSLVVDFIDQNSQLIWRGATESRVVKKLEPAQRTQRVNDSVEKVMRNFPPQSWHSD